MKSDNSINLAEVPQEVLEKELEKRKELLRLAKIHSRKIMRQEVIRHRDILLSLMTHSRNSCSSGKIKNDFYHRAHGAAECNKCALMSLEEWMDDVEVSVEVRLNKVKDEA